MYNFGMPAQFKAYIDNIVRVGRTFGFDRNRDGEPYWPLVPDGKSLVMLSSRGDYGYDLGERLERKNYVEAGVMTPFAYIGVIDLDLAVAAQGLQALFAAKAGFLVAAERRAVGTLDRFVDRLDGLDGQYGPEGFFLNYHVVGLRQKSHGAKVGHYGYGADVCRAVILRG